MPTLADSPSTRLVRLRIRKAPGGCRRVLFGGVVKLCGL
jgi:hypothetical protein